MLLKIKKMSEIINSAIATFLGLMLIAIAIFTTVDLMMVFLFNIHITGAIEIIELSMPWVICMGFAFALIQGAHVRVNLIISRFSGSKQMWVESFDHFLAFLCLSILSYGAWLFFWSSWVISERSFVSNVLLPAWLGKFALPFGFFLMALQHLIALASAIKTAIRSEKR